MTRMQQMLHILKKDIRQRWPEITGVLALTVLLTIVSIDNPVTPSVRLNVFLRTNDINLLVYALFPIAWCVLVARVVHGESLPGRDQLWLTRPYNRLSLVLAKFALVLLCVHLPLVVAHAVILKLSDLPYTFGAMAIGHLVLFAVLTLPAMVVASLTRSLGQFVAVSVGILVGVLAVIYAQHELLRDVSDFVSDSRREPDWTALALVYMFAAICAAAACAWQYRTRRTRIVATTLASVAVLSALAIVIDAPRNVARALELRRYDSDTAAPLVTFGPPEFVEIDPVGMLYLRFPQTGMTGGPDSPALHDWRVQLISASGEQFEQFSVDHRNGVSIVVGREWLARFGDSPLQVRIDYVVETFDEKTRQQIRIAHDDQAGEYRDASLIDGRLHCWFAAWEWMRPDGSWGSRSRPFTTCRSAFMSPRDWHFELVRTADGLTGMITHEKAELPIAIDPIIEDEFSYWSADSEVVDELFAIDTLPLIVRERAMLERHRVEFDDIVLSDLIADD